MKFPRCRLIPCLLRVMSVVVAVVCAACSVTVPEDHPMEHKLRRAQADLEFARTAVTGERRRIAYLIEACLLADGEIGGRKHGAEAVAIYRESASRLVRLLRTAERGGLWTREMEFATTRDVYRLRYRPGGADGAWTPGLFTGFQDVSEIWRSHLRSNRTVDGVGAPLVGLRKTGGAVDFEPDCGLAAPVTATVTRAGGKVELALWDPSVRESASVGGGDRRLAADFTAPVAWAPPRIELWEGLKGLIDVDEHMLEAGIRMIEPYDPGKIPVILVHGLASTPQMWNNVVNELGADPALRGRYQFWVFRYPTGNPPVYSAWLLRQELARIEARYHPKHGYVLLGHSMGGLLARMQVTTTGKVLWNQTFGRQADPLYAKLPEDNLIRRTLVFRADPRVKRVVFVCVPHRGSELAKGSLGSLVIRLIKLPAYLVHTVTDTVGVLVLGPDGKPELPNSINGLTPGNPVLTGLDKLPMRAPFHSILGDRGRGDGEGSSDGVVPYWSSHLRGAESEVFVPGGHGCYEQKESIREITRILRDSP